jgi:predicted tellurium resistance membrane protein TerC
MELLTVENGIAFLTLTLLEIVLGIDNIVFIAILTSRLPPAQQAKARQLGLLAAMGTRILFLLAISVILGLTKPLFAVLGHEVTGKDLVLMGGGLFLLAKATWEIHDKLETPHEAHGAAGRRAAFGAVIGQIMLLDVVFSIDSVITAVGMAQHVGVMIAAVVAAVIVMMVSAGPVSRFVERHPTIKMLALSFLLLIGATLVVEGFGGHVAKGYIYFAMGFSLLVELLNIRVRKARQPLQLNAPRLADSEP